MTKLFGTDGIRGVANREPLTPETCARLGYALARVCREHLSQNGPVLIGRDTRRSGQMIEAAFSSGLCSGGAEVLLLGEVPTPAVACLTREFSAAAGVVISASHNSFPDNGIKVFNSVGEKISPKIQSMIEELAGESSCDDRPVAGDVASIGVIDDADQRYVRALLESVEGLSLKGQRIVLDCAHGAAWRVGPSVFLQLGAEVECLGNSPTGLNINDGCGAMHPESLQQQLRLIDGSVGVAVDGDADRLLLIDERAEVVDGDECLALLATWFHQNGRLGSGGVVGTVMSNMGLEVALSDRGIVFARSAVGDQYVAAEMRERSARLGGEPSGHVILSDYATTGDGLLAALQVLRVMAESGSPLCELKTAMTRFPQRLANIRVSSRVDLESLTALQDCLQEVDRLLAGRGRVLLRYSGTEPLLRVMVEGEDETIVDRSLQQLVDILNKEVGCDG